LVCIRRNNRCMATDRSLSTLFWNVWVQSQLTATRLKLLTNRIDTILVNHAPDVLGLNEVVVNKATGRSALLDHLEKAGYHTYFAPFTPERNGDMSGSALVTKLEPLEVKYHELGPDKYGARRGHTGTVKLIHAKLPLGSVPINIVVNYLAHLAPYNWSAHIKHHKAFRLITSVPELQVGTVIGGDFNQFKFMHRLWGAKSFYQRATGTFLNPTWKLLGKIPIIQANYDNIFWTKCGTLQLEDFKVLARGPSDHAPLIARFVLTPRNSA
jgi:endonuclease/exonuclease/phosphatase family metal-dependent hydrolase